MADPQSTVVAPSLTAAFTGFAQREGETQFVLDFVEKSSAHRAPFVDVWKEVLDNYLVVPFDDGAFAHRKQWLGVELVRPDRDRDRSRLKDPETHQVIEALSQQALGLLLSGRDFITATPVGSDDYDKSRLLARLLMSLLEQPGVWRTHYQLFKNAFTFGTSILEIGWEARTRKQLVPTPVFDAFGGIVGTELQPQEVQYRDRPLMREVDIFDFFPDPSGTRIQEDMLGVVKRFRITKQMALELADAGVYDKADVEKAVEAMGEKKSMDGHGYNEEKFPNLPKDVPDRYGRLIGFEFYGQSPVRTSDGVSNRVITLLNGQRVRSRINPWVDGNIPFKEVVVNPVSGRFYGLSPAEVIRFLQDSADNMLMAFNDAANAAVRGPLLVGHAFGGNPTQLKERRLLDLIPCRDPESVKPLPVDLGALEFAAQELIRRKLAMREASGATNPLQAIPGSDRQTATEVSELVRLASQKVEIMVQLIERDDYPWIGRTLHSRLKQFLPEGGAVATLGGELFEVPFEAIDIDADIRFVGSRQAQSKFQKVAAYREALNVLGPNMEMVLTMPEVIVRYLRDGLDIPDAEEIVQKAGLRILARLQAQMQASQAAGAAPAPGGSPTGSTEESFGTRPGETEREGQRVA